MQKLILMLTLTVPDHDYVRSSVPPVLYSY